LDADGQLTPRKHHSINSSCAQLWTTLRAREPYPGRPPRWLAAKLLATFTPDESLELLRLLWRLGGDDQKIFWAAVCVLERRKTESERQS
jgi:hypothetical protein